MVCRLDRLKIFDYLDNNNLTKKEFCNLYSIDINSINKIFLDRDVDVLEVLKIAQAIKATVIISFKNDTIYSTFL